MTALARIDTAPFADRRAEIPKGGNIGDKPQLRWIAIDCLRVDRDYQRDIGRRGSANIVRIAVEFDWSSFATVVVAEHEEGLFTIIDGQHRTTAAALRGIRDVPCQIVKADRAAQARAFAAINSVVTAMSSMQLHVARLAGGDDRAVKLAAACDRAGVIPCRYPVAVHNMKAGETMAVGTLYRLLEKYGEATFVAALSCITKTRNGYPGFLRQELAESLCAVLEAEPAWRDGGGALLKAVGKIDLARAWSTGIAESGASRRQAIALLIERIGNHLEQALGEGRGVKERGRPWTQEDTDKALGMARDRVPVEKIAAALDRTPGSVKGRIDYVTMPSEKRQKVRDRINEYRRSFRSVGLVTVHGRPSAELLEERDRLLSLPRDTTAELMGDPLPGRSALDRRRG